MCVCVCVCFILSLLFLRFFNYVMFSHAKQGDKGHRPEDYTVPLMVSDGVFVHSSRSMRGGSLVWSLAIWTIYPTVWDGISQKRLFLTKLTLFFFNVLVLVVLVCTWNRNDCCSSREQLFSIPKRGRHVLVVPRRRYSCVRKRCTSCRDAHDENSPAVKIPTVFVAR